MKRRRITGAPGPRRVFALLAGLALAATSAVVAVAAPAHAATTTITVSAETTEAVPVIAAWMAVQIACDTFG